jgi:hypothetical protein
LRGFSFSIGVFTQAPASKEKTAQGAVQNKAYVTRCNPRLPQTATSPL